MQEVEALKFVSVDVCMEAYYRLTGLVFLLILDGCGLMYLLWLKYGAHLIYVCAKKGHRLEVSYGCKYTIRLEFVNQPVQGGSLLEDIMYKIYYYRVWLHLLKYFILVIMGIEE